MDMELSKDMIRQQLQPEPASSTDIIFNFELSMSTRLEDLRINITTLLRLLPDLKGYCVITLLDPNTTAENCVRILWRDLQRTVFLFLSDILDQRPSKQDQPLPQIWIDGHGIILRATYPATATSDEFIIPCDYAYDVLTETELRDEGYETTTQIDKSICHVDKRYPYQYSRLQIKPDSLIRMWVSLRDSHWLDWEWRDEKVK
jgi:hypothetical protein